MCTRRCVYTYICVFRHLSMYVSLHVYMHIKHNCVHTHKMYIYISIYSNMHISSFRNNLRLLFSSLKAADSPQQTWIFYSKNSGVWVCKRDWEQKQVRAKKMSLFVWLGGLCVCVRVRRRRRGERKRGKKQERGIERERVRTWERGRQRTCEGTQESERASEWERERVCVRER